MITVAGSVEEAVTAELWPVYDAVFGDQPSYAAWREGTWDRHVARGDLRLARAYEADRVVLGRAQTSCSTRPVSTS